MMPSPCFDPALGQRALESARGGEATLTPDLARHVAACPECAITLERSRRMAAAMREAEPARAEVAAAHARFLARRGRRGVKRAVPVVVAFASLLCTALAFAATVRYAVVHGILSVPILAPAEPAAAPAPPPPRKHGRGSPRSGAPASPAAIELDAVDAGSEVLAAAAPPIEPELAPIDPMTLPVAPPPAPPRRAASPPATPSSWQLAAKAMSAKDYAGAERAFDELARSPDPKTRDAARLARAQLLIAQGRGDAARPELAALATSGATTLVRERAADALHALDGH